MKNKNIRAMLAFMFIALVLASFALFASAEDVTYTYSTQNDEVLATDTVAVPNTVIVNLPDTTWKLDMINNNSKFKVHVATLNRTDAPQLNIKAREVNLSNQTYDSTVGVDSGTYRVKYGYAFNVSELGSKTYTATLDYSGYSVSNPVMIKCDFDFISNQTDISTCQKLTTTSHDTTNDLISASATGFSSFFIAHDTTSPVQPPSGGGGGGGGGGGSTLGGPKLIYVTPTPEGDSVKVFQGDELIILYEDGEYHFRVDSVGHWKVTLKSLATYMPYEIKLGDFRTLGLKSFLSRDVEVSMYVSNEFAMLTFKTISTPRFSIPLLAPRARTATAEEAEEIESAGQPAAVYTPRPTTPTTTGAGAGEEGVQETQIPESPINLWTILIAMVLVIFLLGGVALYRARLHHLEKPPTVTRTGLESSGLPEISSEDSEPARPLTQANTKMPGGKVPEKKLVVEKQISKPAVPMIISTTKKLELEKYIFHAYSLGFTELQVKKALLEKGWPGNVIDAIIKEIKPKT